MLYREKNPLQPADNAQGTMRNPMEPEHSMHPLFSRIALMLLPLLLVFPGIGTAQEREITNPNAPITIEADRMESRQHDNTVIFTGNVVANQGEITINAAKMTVIYLAAAKGGKGDAAQKIEKLRAEGAVRIIKQDLTATSEALDFFAYESKVILTGEAKAWQGKNVVTGDRIVLFLDEGRSVVDSGEKETSSRVTATIYPESDSDLKK